MASDAQSAEAAALKAKCERWWQPREAPLAGQAAPAIFDFKVRSESGGPCSSILVKLGIPVTVSV